MARFESFLGAQIDDDAAVLGDLGDVGVQLGDDETLGVRRNGMRIEAVKFALALEREQPVAGAGRRDRFQDGPGRHHAADGRLIGLLEIDHGSGYLFSRLTAACCCFSRANMPMNRSSPPAGGRQATWTAVPFWATILS